MNTVYDKVRRLVNFATGDEYGDGEIVTDIISGYAEPGYGSDDSVIVLGNWNPQRVDGVQEDYWHSTNPRVTLPVRLARSLERVGASIEWCNEWTSCQGCYKAVRTTADSYSWQQAYAYVDDEILCHACLHEMGIDALTDYLNDPSKCVTWCEPAHVESFGFVKWAPGDEHTYESGLHKGMTDDPQRIYDGIGEQYADMGKSAPEVLFFLDEQSQFYVTFSAYVREAQEEDE